MFQEARRYLPSAASLAATAAAHGKGLASHLRYEAPDTTLWALAGTTFNLLNGTTGPGLLALPLAFSRCGWLLGSLILLLVFILNHVALLFLLKACLATREHSYIGLSLRSSPELAMLVDWASLAFFFGSCVSYLVIIGDTFGQITARFGSGTFYVGEEVMHYSTLALIALVLFTAAVLAPLSMLKSMDSLQITSGVAMVCIVYAVLVIVATPANVVAPAELSNAASASLTPPSSSEPQAIVFSSQSLLSLPTMAFCFASQSLFPPALETLHQPATYEHMNTVVNVTMGLTLLLHALVAFGGYLRYGADVTANVLDSLPPSRAVGVARFAIVLAFAFTYPMMIFLCRMHIQSIMARLALAKQQTDKPGPATPVEEQHTLVSTLLVVGTLLCAVLFPNIDAIFGLLGGTTAVVISFVAPALFWERFVGYMYKWSHPRKLFCKVLVAFAIVVAGLSLPGLLIDLVSDMYATAWWVPMATAGDQLQSWPGGIEALSSGELKLSAGMKASAASRTVGPSSTRPE